MNKFDSEISLEDLDRVVGGAHGGVNGTGDNGVVRAIKVVVNTAESIAKSIWPF